MQLYADLMKLITDCYEIMDFAEKVWETEIAKRNKEKNIIQLMEIFRNLIKIFSLQQTNHITHRDIKLQNILLNQKKINKNKRKIK